MTDSSRRPSQVTVAGWAVIVAGALLVLDLFDAVANLNSVEMRTAVEESLSTGPGSGLGISVDEAIEMLRWVLLVGAAAGAAAAILGFYVLRRDRGARIALAVAAVPVVLTAAVGGGFFGAVVAGGTAMLWTAPARDWFAGRPVRQPDRPFGPLSFSGSRSGSGSAPGSSPGSSEGARGPWGAAGPGPDGSGPGAGSGSGSGDSRSREPAAPSFVPPPRADEAVVDENPAPSAEEVAASPAGDQPVAADDDARPQPVHGFGSSRSGQVTATIPQRPAQQAPAASSQHPGQGPQHGSAQGSQPWGQAAYPPQGQPQDQPQGQQSWPPPGPYGPGAPGAYGQGPYGSPYGGPQEPARPPRPVVLACLVSAVFSGITLIGAVVLMGILATDSALLVDRIAGMSEWQEAGLDDDFIEPALWTWGVILLLWCIASLVLTWFTWKRSNGARIGLVVSAIVAGVFSVLAFPVSLGHLVATAATAASLLSPSARDWFSSPDRRPW